MLLCLVNSLGQSLCLHRCCYSNASLGSFSLFHLCFICTHLLDQPSHALHCMWSASSVSTRPQCLHLPGHACVSQKVHSEGDFAHMAGVPGTPLHTHGDGVYLVVWMQRADPCGLLVVGVTGTSMDLQVWTSPCCPAPRALERMHHELAGTLDSRVELRRAGLPCVYSAPGGTWARPKPE